ASHNSSPFKDEIRNGDPTYDSPEYIMELDHTHWSPLPHTQLTVEQRDSWRRCPDSHVGCQRSESASQNTETG
uniref:Uncharacterized protein n=1 Tax=Oncorhynchus mykiss TaxID=8022 RepID=A0A8C7R1V0_ONCMY